MRRAGCGKHTRVKMKRIVGWATTGLLILAALQMRAQTNTNAPSVDYLTSRLQFTLKGFTNSDTTGSIESGAARLNSKDIIQLLSGRLSFPLETILNGDENPIPHRAAGAMTNFSPSAKLLLLQALGTNHGANFVVVRDGRPAVDYDVSDYFTFSKRGFESTGTNQVVRTTTNPNNPITVAAYLQEVTFDNLINGGGGDRVAFRVAGFTKERRGPVKVKLEVIDDSAIKDLQSDVAGTGSLADNFMVLRGTIAATGSVKESK
jgi:hypothetical protein